jgi:hypothetical protein
MLADFWKLLKSDSDNRAIVFGLLMYPILFVFFGWFDPTMDINKHAFSGCMTEPNAVSAYMDSIGFWMARLFRAAGISFVSSIVFCFTYYVLEMVPRIFVTIFVGIFKIARGFGVWSYEVCAAVVAPKDQNTSSGFHLDDNDSLYEAEHSIGWFRASVEFTAYIALRVLSTRWAVTLINVVVAVAVCVAWMVLSAPRVCYASAPPAYIMCVGLFITLFCVLAPLEIVSTVLLWNKAKWLRSFMSQYMRSVMYRMNTHGSSFTIGDLSFSLDHADDDHDYLDFSIAGAGTLVGSEVVASKLALWKRQGAGGYAEVRPHVAEAHYYAMRKVNRITFEDLACIVEAHKLRTLSKVNELKQAGAEEAAEQ